MLGATSSESDMVVLIETLWNVKTEKDISRETGEGVLIETLWNVKRQAVISNPLIKGSINRNIVECKE